MNSEIVDAFLSYNCLGREKITSSRLIERQLDISGFTLRQNINLLRCQCKPIASERDGYFYATKAKDLKPTIRRLRKMRAALDAAIKGLEKAQKKLAKRS